jgi:multimeric flavodoxin WrbA
MNKPLIILGSSRSNGSTMEAIQTITQNRAIPLVDLSQISMSYYDYENTNRHDDFLPLAERMVEHSPIILATPVYWYTMSAVMKTFLDRWTDLLTIRKDLGRKLANKKIFLITSFSTSFPNGFEEIFSQTFEYMDMHYGGCYYHYSGVDATLLAANPANAQKFTELVFNRD